MVAPARRAAQGLAIGLVGLAAVATPVHLAGLIARPLPPGKLAILDLFFVAFSTALWVRANRRVVLHADAIEVDGWLGSRTLQRSAIEGRRMSRPSSRGRHYIIVPVDRRERPLPLPAFLQIDKHFLAWMHEIPLLDKRRRPPAVSD